MEPLEVHPGEPLDLIPEVEPTGEHRPGGAQRRVGGVQEAEVDLPLVPPARAVEGRRRLLEHRHRPRLGPRGASAVDAPMMPGPEHGDGSAHPRHRNRSRRPARPASRHGARSDGAPSGRRAARSSGNRSTAAGSCRPRPGPSTSSRGVSPVAAWSASRNRSRLDTYTASPNSRSSRSSAEGWSASISSLAMVGVVPAALDVVLERVGASSCRSGRRPAGRSGGTGAPGRASPVPPRPGPSRTAPRGGVMRSGRPAGLDRRTMLRSRAPRSGLTKWLRRRSTAEPSYGPPRRSDSPSGLSRTTSQWALAASGRSPQRADQLLAVGRVDHVVVEVDERELGGHPVEQRVHVPEPALLLAVGEHLHPVVVGAWVAAESPRCRRRTGRSRRAIRCASWVCARAQRSVRSMKPSAW